MTKFQKTAFDLRVAQDIPITDAARKLGLTFNELWSVEHSGLIPDEPVIRKMARLYAADPDVLLGIAAKSAAAYKQAPSPSLEELAQTQNVAPMDNAKTLSGTWPGTPDDGFEAVIDELRHGSKN